MKVMKTSSLTVVVATFGPGASNSELPNFFQFWKRVNSLLHNNQSHKSNPSLNTTPQTFLLATAFDAFLVSILKVRTIYRDWKRIHEIIQLKQVITLTTVDMLFTLYFFPSSSSILYSVIVLILPLIVSFGEGSVAVNDTKTSRQMNYSLKILRRYFRSFNFFNWV